VLSDEGGIFGTVAGRYNSGISNADALLKGFTGGDIRVDRRGRAPEYVERASITMGLTVQPEVLKELHSNTALRGRGLLARPIYSIPRANIGRRKSAFATRSVPTSITAAYAEGMLALLGYEQEHDEHGAPISRSLALSPEAIELLILFDSQVERDMCDEARLGGIAEWAGKLSGTVCRLAGILQICDDPASEIVGADAAWHAIQVCRYAIEHAIHAHAVMAANDDLERARIVLEAIQRQPDRDITRRDLQQRLKRRLKAAELDGTLAVLVEHGYLRTHDGQAFDRNPHMGTLGTLGTPGPGQKNQDAGTNSVSGACGDVGTPSEEDIYKRRDK